jgi:hypothetical protein
MICIVTVTHDSHSHIGGDGGEEEGTPRSGWPALDSMYDLFLYRIGQY